MAVTRTQGIDLNGRRPAIFFDRDGVLNEDLGFVHKPEQLQWVAGAREAVSYLTKLGYLIFVVTNQSGIARGFYGAEDVEKLHRVMQDNFKAFGGRIDAFAYCPHHPEAATAAFRQHCQCRKPSPGMIFDLMQKWPVDRRRSLLIGDQPRDLAAATAAGIASALFRGGNLLEFLQAALRELDANNPIQSTTCQSEELDVCTA